MGKNKTGMILIITLLIVLLLSFIVGFVIMYNLMNKANNEEVKEIIVKEELSMEEITNFPIGDPILTNLLEGPDKKRHVIKISVSLGINTSKGASKEAAKLIPILEAQKPAIKDIIIGVCRNKTFEELNRNDAKAILKEEILLNIQQKFETDLVVEAYIDEIFLD